MHMEEHLEKIKVSLQKSLFELGNSSQSKIANKVNVNSVKPTLAYYLNFMVLLMAETVLNLNLIV